MAAAAREVSTKRPSVGASAQEAYRDISPLLAHRYNWIRPHRFNDGLPPAVSKEKLDCPGRFDHYKGHG